MLRPPRPPLFRYGLAIAAVAAMIGLRLGIAGLVGERLPYIAFFFAVIVTAWFGGLGPSVLAVALSTFAVKFLFIPEVRSLRVAHVVDVVGLALFVAVNAAIIAFSEANRNGRRWLEREVAERQRAEALIRRDSLLLANVHDSVVVTDLDGVVTFWNKGAERLLGWTAEEMLGRPMVERMPEADRPRAAALIRRIADGEEFAGEWPDHRKDGTPIWRDVRTAPLRDADGRPIGIMGVSHDITERKRVEGTLRESERRLRQLADTMPQVVWTAGPDGSVTYFNGRWYEYTGLSPEMSLTDDGWRRAVHPEDLGRLSEVRAGAVGGSESFEVEARVRRRDGVDRWHLIRSVPIRDEEGRVVRRFGAATDIDDLKRAGAALREADRRKDDFLATLAHELRNPLAPLRNGLELIRLAGDDRGAVEEARRTMERQLRHVVRLIDDLLDVSRITRGKLRLRRERVEVAEAIRGAVEANRLQFESGGIELIVALPAGPLDLDADPTRLVQVLSNLLNNAAKFSDRGGRVWLTAERRGGDVAIVVRDEGIGIAPEHLPHLFEMFAQVDPALERTQGGLGIGLALVKGLVEMHGGTVAARSEGIGRGSELVVRLPALAERPDIGAVDEPDVPATKEAASARRVLVVDDMRDSARTLSALLKLMGHETRMAHDGLEAVAAAETYRPEIILMDIGMPALNGYDACRLIRQQDWGRRMTLVALTGWGQENDKERATAAGFDRHLVKPIDPDDLSKLMAEVESSPA